LKHYLVRKVKERGWDGASRPDVEGLAERLAGLGYIDDEAFAAARASSLQRRGYGERRVAQSLRAAGIAEEDAAGVRDQLTEGAREAAFRFARRKRIGPFASQEPDRDARQKAFAAMMRAGHPMDIVREVLNASPEDIPDSDNI
jgi:regulatory protein